MVQRVTTFSDLSDEPGAAPVQFALDGRELEIDLTAAERERLKNELAPYRAAARPAGGRDGERVRAEAKALRDAVREWARSSGVPVPDRGRVPREVTRAYFLAQQRRRRTRK